MKASKTFDFGKVAESGTRKVNLVEVEINLKDTDKGPVFSASACIWDAKHYDHIMGGQCIDTIYQYYGKQLTDLPLYLKIMGLWERNHLNDMNAGIPVQMQAVEAYLKQGNKYDYVEVCDYLKSINLYEIDGYKYGYSWIYRAISDTDLKEIKALLN